MPLDNEQKRFQDVPVDATEPNHPALYMEAVQPGKVRIHTRPIRYGSADGVQRPVRPELVPSLDGWDASENTLRFQADDSGHVWYRVGDYGVRMRLLGRVLVSLADVDSETPTTTPAVSLRDARRLRWSEVLGAEFDIEYEVQPGRIKEFITLPAVPPLGVSKAYGIVWQYQTLGLVPELVNGDIRWSDTETQTARLRFPAPTAIDAGGNRLRCSFRLRGDKLAVIIPSVDLAAAAYPVVIDPTATTGVGDVTASVATGEYLGAGKFNYNMAFCKFANLPDLTGYNIDAASVFLYGENTNTHNFTMYFDVTGAWTEASSETVLEALSFNGSVNTGVGSTYLQWDEYDVTGNAGKGMIKIYADAGGDPSAVLATLRITSDTGYSSDDTDPNTLCVGPDAGAASPHWADDSDPVEWPYIEIDYSGPEANGAVTLAAMTCSGVGVRLTGVVGASSMTAMTCAGSVVKSYTTTGTPSMSAMTCAGVGVTDTVLASGGLAIPEVLHLRMDDNAASATILDSSANGNNQTFLDAGGNPNTDAHTVAGRVGTALSFDGVDDYIALGASLDGALTAGQDFAIAFWWSRGLNNDEHYKLILEKQANNGYIRATNSYYAPTLQQYTSFNIYRTVSPPDSFILNANYVGYGWNHYVLQRQNTTFTLWFNGALVGTNTTAGNDRDFSGTAGFFLGGAGASYHSQGSMDDFRVYDRVLSHTEIAWLRMAQPPVGISVPAITCAGVTVMSRFAEGAPSMAAMACAGAVVMSRFATGTPSAAAMTCSGTAARVWTATGTPATAAMTCSGAGAMTRKAAGDPALAALTCSGVGVRVTTATGTPSLASMTCAGVADNWISSPGDMETAAMECAGVVVMTRFASGTPSLAAMTCNGAVVRTGAVTGALALGSMTCSGAASFTTIVTATGALTFEALSLAGEAGFTTSHDATGAVSMAAMECAGVAPLTTKPQTHTVTSALSLASMTCAGIGVAGYSGTGAVTMAGMTCAGLVAVYAFQSATAGPSLPAMTLAGVVSRTCKGVAALSAAAMTASAPGIRTVTVAASPSLNAFTMASVTSRTFTRTGTGALSTGAMACAGVGVLGPVFRTSATLAIAAMTCSGAGVRTILTRRRSTDGLNNDFDEAALNLPAMTCSGAVSRDVGVVGELAIKAMASSGAVVLSHDGTGTLSMPAFTIRIRMDVSSWSDNQWYRVRDILEGDDDAPVRLAHVEAVKAPTRRTPA